MICDLHVHTCYSPDSAMKPGRIVQTALRRGLDAIAVTDHDTITGGQDVLRESAGTSLVVIPGVEIRTNAGEIIGLYVCEDIPAGQDLVQTIAAIRAQGGVVVIPHPCDRYRSSAVGLEALQQIGHLVDAIETLNSRNLDYRDDRAAEQWAAEHGCPRVAGSDAHEYYEIGRGCTRMAQFRSAQGFKEALGTAEVLGRRSSPLVHMATAVRKRMKLRGGS